MKSYRGRMVVHFKREKIEMGLKKANPIGKENKLITNSLI